MSKDIQEVEFEIVEELTTGFIVLQNGNVQIRIPVEIPTKYTKWEDGRQDCEIQLPKLAVGSKSRK